MFHRHSLALASALSLVAGAAHAQLTADQLWQSWQDAGVRAGLSVAAAGVARDGAVLTLTDVTVKPAVTDGAAAVAAQVGDIVLTEGADGSVAITLPAEIAVPFDADGSRATFSHDGLMVTARADGGTTSYDYSAAAVNVKVDVTGQAPAAESGSTATPTPQVTTQVTVDAVAPRGAFTDSAGTDRRFGLTLDADTLGYDVRMEDPAMGFTQAQTNRSQDVTLAADLVLPGSLRLAGIDSAAALAAALDAGLTARLDLSQGVTTATDGTVGGPFSYEMSSESAPGKGSFALDDSGVGITASGEGAVFTVSAPAFPFPEAKVTLGPIVMDVRVPLTGPETRDFRYLVKLDEVTVNDEVWAAFDPGATLPRGPANLSIDLTGRAMLPFLDLIDADATGTTPQATPTIEALTVNEIALNLAGAALAGSGSFTFDNATGVPKPLGAMDVALTGGNRLIDGLVAIGALPEEQAASARMMFAMFAVPGEGEDSLTTRIEAREDGGLYVNGQRVQ